MKLLILDIDGVLNVIPQGFDKFGSLFHPHLVENLKTIIDETNANIVISSSWRLMGLEMMQRMWEERKLPGKVIDITVNGYSLLHTGEFKKGFGRGDEIKYWLDHQVGRNIEKYVIIDDDDFDLLKEQKHFLVKTSGNKDHEDCVDFGYGLTKKCAEKAIKILNDGK